MSLKCALKILEDKKLIDIEFRDPGRHSNLPRCHYYEVSSKNHNLINRIHKEASKNDEYICSKIEQKHDGYKSHSYFKIVKTKGVDEWLKDNCKKEETQIIGCEDFISNYLLDYTNYYQSSDCNGYLIINEKAREERIKKEKEEEKKAIELFESML